MAAAGRTLLWLVGALLLSWTAAQTARITEEDDLCLCVSVCVSVNETNEVGFTCISEADLILWRVDTRQIAASVDGIEVTTTANSSGGFVSSLVFTPEFLSSMSNGSEFQVGCLVQRSLFDIVEQDTREVVLFSTPSPPEDLRVVPTAMPLQYNIVWNRPADLPECVSIVYFITVENIETNRTLLDRERTINEFEPYNDVESGACQLHLFEVAVKTLAGTTSLPATTRVTLPISPNVENMNVMATPFPGDETLIGLSFQPATTCDRDTYPILSYSIDIPELPQFTATVPYTEESVSLNLTSPAFISPSSYTITVSACAIFGCRSAPPLTVSTNEVQDASITFLNTTVSLTCVFTATGSARGCRFSLELPTGDSETFDIDRPAGGGPVQQCSTTHNNREAYLSVVVLTIDRNGGPERVQLMPVVNETDDLAVINPCEPPPPDERVVEKSTLSDGEIAAIVIVVLVVFFLMVIILVVIAWWRWQDIRNFYKDLVHPMTEEEGIDLMVDEEKPTVTMLMNNLILGRGSATTTAATNRQKSLTREESQQPDMAVTPKSGGPEALPLKAHDGAEPTSAPLLTGKEPVAAIKIKDPSEPNALHMILKPATLTNVVRMWRSKVNRGEELLLYWKEDEEDVDDDEPYYQDPEEDDL